MSIKDDFVVYWEKQGQDRMCALHCINSILQGPYVDEFRLSRIAHEIDELENKLLKEESKCSIAGRSVSQNVSDDGFFSIMVLQECLQRMGYSCIPAANPNVQDLVLYPTASCGYIINSSEHWISIRCVRGKWFNLDSLKPGPIVLDYRTVSEELQNFIFSGKSVFVVNRISNESGNHNNSLPDPDPFLRPIKPGDKQKHYLSLPEIDELFRKKHEEEKEINLANMSSESVDFGRSFNISKKEHKWPTSKGNTLQPSLGEERQMNDLCENDPELERAIRESAIEFASRISLPEEPSVENEQAIQIRIRTKMGKFFTRRFEKSQSCSLLFSWIEYEMALSGNPIQEANYSLISQFPNFKLSKIGDIIKVSGSSAESEVLNSPSFNDAGIVANSLLLLDA